MSKINISGIQQVGIGVKDAGEAFKWYNRTFGMDVPVFDDEAEAKLMVPHTAGVVRKRRAILAVNMAGGGGAEIWESRSPLPLEKPFEPRMGDLGIVSIKIKAQNIESFASENNINSYLSPHGQKLCRLMDPYGNAIEVVSDNSWFKPNLSNTGGILGASIGVSDMNKALSLYKNALGLNEIVYDKTGTFKDLQFFGQDEVKFRRVLLKKSMKPEGAFAKLFGNIEIELFQNLDAPGRKLFENRSWGDLGYIHLCFDTLNMEALSIDLKAAGYEFTVDSANSFDMGEAAGRFSYIEDQDGTLLEFVETHKVPVLKKIGWYINLKKRGNRKPLPDFMVSALGWGRVKV